MADDDELLRLMREANFFTIFVGIESPDPKTLVHTKKKQNTRRNLADSVHRIYRAGMFVTAGFIVGFDSEEVSMADAMADFIEEAAIPVCMVGLLYALPNTQLTRRLAAAGRLHPDHDVAAPDLSDQCTPNLNFDTLRPLSEILLDYRRILERVYDPSAFADRLERLSGMLDRSGRPRDLPEGDIRRKVASIEMVHKIITRLPEAREQFWQTFVDMRQVEPGGAALYRDPDGVLSASRAVRAQGYRGDRRQAGGTRPCRGGRAPSRRSGRRVRSIPGTGHDAEQRTRPLPPCPACRQPRCRPRSTRPGGAAREAYRIPGGETLALGALV